jgi:hypothetical protein
VPCYGGFIVVLKYSMFILYIFGTNGIERQLLSEKGSYLLRAPPEEVK